MKEGGTSLNKTFREYNLVFKGLMVGNGAGTWGQKFRSSRQAKLESSPKHFSNTLWVATLVKQVVNLIIGS